MPNRIKRVYQKGDLLIRSSGAILFTILVAGSLFRDGFALTGSGVDLLTLLFFTIYFGGLLWMILPGLLAFQSMEIDREEIRVYYGPLRIRTIPLRCIRSVTRATKFGRKNDLDALAVMILLFESPARCRELGERPLRGTSFWIEDSPQLRSALEKALPRAKLSADGAGSRDGAVTFHRMRLWPMGIGFFFFALGFLIMGTWGMSDGFTDWKLPFWKMDLGMGIFLFCFLLLWYAIPIWAMLHMRQAFQTIRLDWQEVRLCVGPIVLRRIPCRRIRSVIRTGATDKANEEECLLFLCTDGLDALRGQGTISQMKKRLIKGRIRSALKIDWTPELENTLKQYLPGAEFVT